MIHSFAMTIDGVDLTSPDSAGPDALYEAGCDDAVFQGPTLGSVSTRGKIEAAPSHGEPADGAFMGFLGPYPPRARRDSGPGTHTSV